MNNLTNKLLTLLLTLLLVVTNFNVKVSANDNENTQESEPTIETYDDGSSFSEEETPIKEETEDVYTKLEELINSLPAKEEVSELSEEEYAQLTNKLEEIETLAEENNIDLTSYDKYVSLFSNESSEEENPDDGIMLLDDTVQYVYDLNNKLKADGTNTIVLSETFTINKTDSTTDANSPFEVKGNKTLDLNGHTINFTGKDDVNNNYLFKLADEASLTIKDSTGNGKIETTNAYAVYLGNNSTFTLESGSLSSSTKDIIFVSKNNSTININGGSITASGNDVEAIVVDNDSTYSNTYEVKDNTINITGGTLTSNNSYVVYLGKNNNKLNISGGTLICNESSTQTKRIIYNGTIGGSDGSQVTITGGFFKLVIMVMHL